MRFGREPAELPTREEALAAESHYYGDVREVYMQPPEGSEGAEAPLLLGTEVAMVQIDTDQIVLSTRIDRAYCRTEGAYRRQIRKIISQEARAIRSYNRTIPGSSAF
jgi:hypothetical protein